MTRRTRTARLSGWLAAVVALGIGCGVVLTASPAESACLAPAIEVDPTAGLPGSSVTVSGSRYMSECRDTIVCEEGEPCTPLPPAPPSQGIQLIFGQGDLELVVAFVDASEDYTFSETFLVPEGTPAGPATIKTENPPSENAISFTVEEQPPPPPPDPAPTTEPDPEPPPPSETQKPAPTQTAPRPTDSPQALEDASPSSGSGGLGTALALAVAAVVVLATTVLLVRRRSARQ